MKINSRKRHLGTNMGKFLGLSLVAVLSGCFYFGGGGRRLSTQHFKQQIENLSCENDERLEGVKKLFEEAGANADEIDVVEFERATNIVTTIRGNSKETVIIGAHYDKTTLGCGAIDNWTGIVILANLYVGLKSTANEKTLQFVAFGAEEKGLLGSRAMVEAIPESEKANYCAMVNLDSFGFGDIWTLERVSSEKLIELAKKNSAALGEDFRTKDFKRASADSASFKNVGIPAITFSGLNDDWSKYLHKDGDQVDKIGIDNVYENYLFVRDFIVAIDSESCTAFR